MVAYIPPRRATQVIPSGWQRFLARIQPYQNIIFFVLLIITLVIVLILWRGYRVGKRNLQAWEAIFDPRVPRTVENYQNLVQMYSGTEVIPFIHYRLGNIYCNFHQYDKAKKEYQYFLKHYPDHPLGSLVELQLKKAERNEQWQKDEKKRYLTELKDKRNLPRVTIKTKRGDFEVELYEDDAPNTVANFISLAERGIYNQISFSERTPELGLCLGTKGYPLYYTIEFEKNSLRNLEGWLGMIRNLDPETQDADSEREEFLNSACSRFYICLKNNPVIDGKYTVFGRVSKGMQVVRQLSKWDEIISVVVNKKRDHEYKPEVIKQERKPEYSLPSPP